MIELEELRRLLADLNLQKVAEASGISYGKLYRLKHVPEGQPAYDTVVKLANYFEERQLNRAA